MTGGRYRGEAAKLIADFHRDRRHSDLADSDLLTRIAEFAERVRRDTLEEAAREARRFLDPVCVHAGPCRECDTANDIETSIRELARGGDGEPTE